MVEVVDYGGGAERTATLTEPVVNIDLTGRVAVVTGGVSGIGLACARGLSEAGADVMVASPFEADQARVHNITEDEVLRKVFLAMTSVNRLPRWRRSPSCAHLCVLRRLVMSAVRR
jgi:short chain dehydrogenase